MTSSFSQYASKFLNARLATGSSLASSQPLFYSFQESSDGEGSIGRLRPAVQSRDDLELDDNGEPRLRGDEELDDPYLRLDEDDGDGTLRESARLLASEVPSTQGGWLAHQTSPLPSRAPTPTPPSSEDSPSSNVDDTRPPIRTNLTESLLPRDGVSRSVFFLPDPGRTPRHRYNDANWTVLWCTALLISVLASVLSLFLTRVRRSNHILSPAPHIGYAVTTVRHAIFHTHTHYPTSHRFDCSLHVSLVPSHPSPPVLHTSYALRNCALHPHLPNNFRSLCFLRIFHL